MTSGTMRLAFLDLVFNLLLGITLMFVIAFLLINPPTTDGQIDPPVRLMVEMEWNKESRVDIDLWVRGKDGDWVGFKRQDGKYFVLERDDRGTQNDTIEVNGERVVIKRNYENTRFTILPPGEYFVNVHYFTPTGNPEEIEINLTQLNPYKSIYTGKVTLNTRQETTVVSFVVDDNENIVDIRTDVQIPYVTINSPQLPPGPAGENPW